LVDRALRALSAFITFGPVVVAVTTASTPATTTTALAICVGAVLQARGGSAFEGRGDDIGRRSVGTRERFSGGRALCTLGPVGSRAAVLTIATSALSSFAAFATLTALTAFTWASITSATASVTTL
jgi:hypothetical protein